jgi:hypothetical protein
MLLVLLERRRMKLCCRGGVVRVLGGVFGGETFHTNNSLMSRRFALSSPFYLLTTTAQRS